MVTNGMKNLSKEATMGCCEMLSRLRAWKKGRKQRGPSLGHLD